MNCPISAHKTQLAFETVYRKESKTERRCPFSSGSAKGSKSPSHSLVSVLRSFMIKVSHAISSFATEVKKCFQFFLFLKIWIMNARFWREYEARVGYVRATKSFGGVNSSSHVSPTHHSHTTQWLLPSQTVTCRTRLEKFPFLYRKHRIQTYTSSSVTMVQTSHCSLLHPHLIRHLQYL